MKKIGSNLLAGELPIEIGWTTRKEFFLLDLQNCHWRILKRLQIIFWPLKHVNLCCQVNFSNTYIARPSSKLWVFFLWTSNAIESLLINWDTTCASSLEVRMLIGINEFPQNYLSRGPMKWLLADREFRSFGRDELLLIPFSSFFDQISMERD